MKKILLFSTTFILFFCCSFTFMQATTHFVNHAATGADDGTSWLNAFDDVQEAIDAATTGDEIWVAQGTYLPTQGSGRERSFVFSSKDVQIYGGFDGTETMRTQRDWGAHPTILSGDIGVAGDKSDNSFDVVKYEEVTNASLMDGFIVEEGRGNENVDGLSGRGAGFYIDANSNGNGIANPIIQNCIIRNNGTTNMGGGVCADANIGGVAHPTFINCLIYGNSAKNGGAVFSRKGTGDGSPLITLINCTVVNNTSTSNGSIISTRVVVKNSIVWGNSNNNLNHNSQTVTNSIVEGNCSNCTDVIHLNPLFTDPSNENYNLQVCSPAIDAATATDAPTHDFNGNPRASNELYDMGAYEFQGKIDVEAMAEILSYEAGCGAGNPHRVIEVIFEGADEQTTYNMNSEVGTFINPKGMGMYQVVGNGEWSIEAEGPNFCSEIITSSDFVYTTDEASTPESGYNKNDGTATVGAIGGTAPYTVDWDNGTSGTITNSGGTHTLTGLASGYYEAIVTDDNGEIAKVCIHVNRTTSGRSGRGRKTAKLEELTILSAQPNPFNIHTNIQFNLPESSQATLGVYGLNGERINTLFAGKTVEGQVYQFEFFSSNLPSGVYVLRLATDKGLIEHQRIMVTK